ncbi:MAG TPA: VWA domain-containing protein [Pyrinomonadaceae bacterium]|nr:VWA domain-containing protein [Pyrinomonadaceae bacterium]
MQSSARRYLVLVSLFFLSVFIFDYGALAQSRPQRPEQPAGTGKKNQRPKPKTEEELKKEAEELKRAEEEKNATPVEGVVNIETNVVNVDAVVYNKKSGQVINGLKKENFAVFEDGVKQTISNFATPEAPITVTLVLEYSKWTETFGRAGGGYFEPGVYESIRPVAQFLSRFIKPPNDYASVIAFDIRPTPITDFTNDPNRIRQTIDLLLRNSPAFRENNLYDALKFALVGGRGDAVVLENSGQKQADYSGMVDVKAKRRAIILVASGIDTFSKINFSDARKIVQEAGIPIYIISTGNLFCKKYCDYLDPMSVMPGQPDRMSFLSATNQLNTFAKESGGMHYPMTFESEIPGYLNSINALLRSQYSLSYDLPAPHEPGKKYKIDVKVDVDGDGNYDDKAYVVQHRPFVVTPKPGEGKEKN